MLWSEITRTVDEARNTLRAADHLATRIAGHLVGRLRHCNTEHLRQLKKELKDFNAVTGEWK